MQALAALSGDVLVSGANDGSLVVWERLPNGREFTSLAVCTEHTGMIRAIVALPPCGSCPAGGFATGCLDKVVRLYSFDASRKAVAFVAALVGHLGGVDSLSLSASGLLLSGGREGHVRVWDLATRACVAVLEGHENSTRVLGLPSGRVVTGSAGRRDENAKHVDFRLRTWAWTDVPKPAYTLERVIADHDQAIQDLSLVSDSIFASASNDGRVVVRAPAVACYTE